MFFSIVYGVNRVLCLRHIPSLTYLPHRIIPLPLIKVHIIAADFQAVPFHGFYQSLSGTLVVGIVENAFECGPVYQDHKIRMGSFSVECCAVEIDDA